MLTPKLSVKKAIDNSANILDAVRALTENDVLVGVPAEKAPRTAEEAHGQPINNAAIAFLMDKGSPSQNIPARPFMDPGIKSAAAPIAKRLGDAGVAAFEGNTQGVLANFTAAGLIAEVSIKRRIRSNIPPPLKPATLRARKRKGFAGTNTLVETGQLLGAIKHVIRRRT